MTEPAKAREHYVADFRAFAQNGGSRAPAWTRDIRERALARFIELGFPTTKQEEWRFTSVAPILATPFARDHGGFDVAERTLAPVALTPSDAIRLVVVNGKFAPGLSRVGELPSGVTVGSLATAIATTPELARPYLAEQARDHANAFAALNTAFLADGAFVHVSQGVELTRPIELLFITAARDARTLSHTRALVVLERGARATAVETYAATRAGAYWTNGVTEIVLGDGARLEHFRVQREGEDAFQTATTHTTQARDSVLRLHPIAFGAELARHDVRNVLAGTGSELILNGLYLLHGDQHADHHTVIDHAQPHANSHEYFNGILRERAHGVFNGRIVVRPGAQRTDSKQTNHNLLLSADARADSQPQLEIYADDVKCTHGSTVGPLDEAAVYYLRSRGLSAEDAAGMLTYGFAAEILDRMDDATVRDGVVRLVRERLTP